MKDSVSKAREVSYTKTDTFQNLGLVITSFCKSVGPRETNRIWEAGSGNGLEMRIHICHKELNIRTIWKRGKVANQFIFETIWEDIHYFSFLGIGEDELVFLAAGIALKLVNGENLRQFKTTVFHKVEIPQSSCAGKIKLCCD